ncbi:MAG: penicillin-binding protein 1C [Hyphomicrobiaceae bacterium]
MTQSAPKTKKTKIWSRRLAILLAISIFLAATGAAGLTFALHQAQNTIGRPPLENVAEMSKTVVDRNGRLLRAYTTRDGLWRLPVTHDDVDEKYLKLLLTFEDRRFWSHGGVDPWAIARAATQLITNRRLVSGASTLTMQVARLVDRKHERTAGGKLRQIARALQLEKTMSKSQILDLYLRIAPFGGNIEGARAASLAYFGKEPKRLSLGQAALLVALPQSPEARRPDRNWSAARRARAHVLETAVSAGILTTAEAHRAKTEPIPTKRLQFPKFTAHLADAEIAQRPNVAHHKLTIDRRIQQSLEQLASLHADRLGQKISTAIVAVDNTTGEVLASVGSAGLLDAGRLGAIDMTNAIRSPGSTLKPLIYGLGFEAGLIHPETFIEDRPVRFGNYAPKNFDKGYHGTVSIRDSLAQSLNIPAVKVLHALGPAKLVARLRKFETAAELPTGIEPSLAVGLGGIGMRLVDLAKIYTGLARNGHVIPLTYRYEDVAKRFVTGAIANDNKNGRLMSPIAASYITDILKDAPPPPNTRPGQIAYKTGTSYGYRDALAIGYDGRHTIAVWVGRADGSSTPGLLGRTAAAPILFDAFTRVGAKRTPLASPPKAALLVDGRDLPPPLKRFRADRLFASRKGPYLETPVSISFPPDRSQIASDIDAETSSPEPLLLRAEGGNLPLTWLVNGAPIRSSPHKRHVVWHPLGAGFVKLTVIDAKGNVDRVTVRLQ